MSNKVDHYEYLECGHQNNLLINQSDGKKSKSGECPKCSRPSKVLQVITIDPELSNTQIAAEP
jgi:hypothetical protein